MSALVKLEREWHLVANSEREFQEKLSAEKGPVSLPSETKGISCMKRPDEE